MISAVASSSLHVSQIHDAEPQILISATSIGEGSMGPEPLLHQMALLLLSEPQAMMSLQALSVFIG